MHLRSHAFVLALPLLLACNGLARAAAAQDTASTETRAEPPLTFTIAPIVYHWRSDPEHKYSFVVTLEQHLERQRLVGLALFRNSFGQPSAYAYAGYQWPDVLDTSGLSLKLSAGIIYGYTGDYEDKVPLNWRGFSPAIIPSVGYQISANGSVNLMVLGTAGVVLGYSHSFPGLVRP